jgi:hypothetical protein
MARQESGDGAARPGSLAEADLVGEQGALRERRRQREECYVHLMRVEATRAVDSDCASASSPSPSGMMRCAK